MRIRGRVDRAEPRRIEELTHTELAALAREYLLAGQMIDRAGMPHLIGAYGRDEMRDIAIDEWMGASPVYTRRMQRALGFEGDDVATMFKGMQLDVGAPPEFMDFRYRVIDRDHGEFWLNHCGALVDVEPMGDDYVVAMCHHIEDPTFEATACASNPRARMSPVHRPPRVPEDRHPHCHWTVEIDHDAEPLAEPVPVARVASSRAATVLVEPFGRDDGDDRGWSDYSGDLDPDMRTDDFSRRALSLITQEAALQGHLLAISFLAAVEDRHGILVATDVGARQFRGVAGLVAERLVREFEIPATLLGLVQVFELHPAFHPRSYVDWRVETVGQVVRIAVAECPATAEVARVSWIGLLCGESDDALQAIASAVDPRAEVHTAVRRSDEAAAWEVSVGGAFQHVHPDVTLTKFSSGAAFEFTRIGRRFDTDGA